MKVQKLFMFMATLFALAACSDGGDDDGGSTEPKTNPDTPTSTINDNKNTSGPSEAQSRLEFPKLKDDVNSEIIIHSTAQYGMTYALEWDHQKRATRWVCWRMDASNRQEKYSRSTLYPNGDPWAYDTLVP